MRPCSDSAPRQIVLATGNEGKLRAIRQLFDDTPFAIVPQSQFAFRPADETGTTFAENALLKARHAAAATGLPALADDSGLVVDALDGIPGIYSARFAGEQASDADNVDKLLELMSPIAEGKRDAAFHCVVALVFPDATREPLLAEGRWRGRIARDRHGHGGFGYDPVFLDCELGKSAAEMTAAEKNARSHRGQAFRELKQRMLGIRPA
jgi:XTP/dITP diphosphohydrolase